MGFAGADLTRWVPPDVGPTAGRGTLADRLRRDAGASLALDLHLPLLRSGGAATVAAREASFRAAARRLETARHAGMVAALDLLSRWSFAARSLTAQQRAAREAEAHVDRIRSLYFAGTTPLLELLDARHLLEDALDRLEDARAELRLAVLETEIGR